MLTRQQIFDQLNSLAEKTPNRLTRQEFHQLLNPLAETAQKRLVQLLNEQKEAGEDPKKKEVGEKRKRNEAEDKAEAEKSTKAIQTQQKLVRKIASLRKEDQGGNPEAILSNEVVTAILFSLHESRKEFSIEGKLNFEVETLFSPLRQRVKLAINDYVNPFIHRLAKFLTSTVVNVPPPGKDLISSYTLIAVPGATIEDLLHALSKHVYDPVDIINALVLSTIIYTRYNIKLQQYYLKRSKELAKGNNPELALHYHTLSKTYSPSIYEFHKLFILAFIETCKVKYDFYFLNGVFAQEFGIPIKELNALEVDFLKMLDFDFNISPESLDKHLGLIFKYNISEEKHQANLSVIAGLKPLEVPPPAESPIPSAAAASVAAAAGASSSARESRREHAAAAVMNNSEASPMSHPDSPLMNDEGLPLPAAVNDNDKEEKPALPVLPGSSRDTLFSKAYDHRAKAIRASTPEKVGGAAAMKVDMFHNLEQQQGLQKRNDEGEAPLKRQCLGVS